MKRGGSGGGGGGWMSGQADKNSGVFCNPSTGWQQSVMALTLKISLGFANNGKGCH